MARARTRRKDAAAERKPKKKMSILDRSRSTWIDYKDVNLLRRFMSERAKIRARRVTGNDAQQQRAVARAIRVAREMALLPYSVRQVTHRNKGKGRGDRDGGARRAVGDRSRSRERGPRRTEVPRAPTSCSRRPSTIDERRRRTTGAASSRTAPAASTVDDAGDAETRARRRREDRAARGRRQPRPQGRPRRRRRRLRAQLPRAARPRDEGDARAS